MLSLRFIPALILASICLIPGCQRPEDRLIGVWQVIEAEELTERMTGETGEDRVDRLQSEDQRDVDEGAFVAGRMEVEFAAGNRLFTRTTIMNTVSEKSGIWRVENIDGDTIKIRSIINGETVTTDIEMLEADKLRMIPPNIDVLNEAFRFKRAK